MGGPVPRHLWDDPRVRGHLAAGDFGAVFRFIRAHTGLTQLDLGSAVGLDQSAVSLITRGKRAVLTRRVVARIVEGLHIPPGLIGNGAPDHDGKVDWVNRRDFLVLVMGAIQTPATLDERQLDFLARTGADTVHRGRLGTADIETIEAVTHDLRRTVAARGGAMCRASAAAQLAQVRELRTASCTPAIRTRLQVATAELAHITGWAYYDSGDDSHARQAWTLALAGARSAEDHQPAIDLAVMILRDMAHQALELSTPTTAPARAHEAATLCTHAENLAARRPVSAPTRGLLAGMTARCNAAFADADGAHRAATVAQEAYARTDDPPTPPWAWFITPAAIRAQEGTLLFRLAQTRPEYAPAAVEHLAAAVDAYPDDAGRDRISAQADLATARIIAGDTDTATPDAIKSADAMAALGFTRGRRDLLTLDAVAARHPNPTDVVELREHIRAALQTLN